MKESLLKIEGYSIAVPHVHTTASDGTLSPREAVKVASQKGVAVIGITDHEFMSGVEEAIRAGKEFGVEIIPGQEVTTRKAYPPCHILALNIQKPIPFFKGTEWTIAQIRKQGGVVILPHPGFASVDMATTKRFIKERLVDGIEAISGGFVFPPGLKEDLSDPICKGVACLGGADSHFRQDIISSYTLFPGKTSKDFLQAIRNRTTIPAFGETPPRGKWNVTKQVLYSLFIFGPKKYLIYYAREAKEKLKR